MADKPPFFKMDPAQFLQDGTVDAMTTLELGAAFRLLCRQWIDGHVPDDLNLLARLCRLDRSAMEQAWVILSKFFPEIEPGKRANRFMWCERETVMAAMKKRQDDGREAVNRRWEAMRQAKDPNRSPIPDPIQDKDKDKDKEKDKEKEKERAAGKPRRRSAGAGAGITEFPQEVLDLAKDVGRIWKREQPDGSKINPDGPLLRERLDQILRETPGVSRVVLFKAAELYLSQAKKSYKAPQFFFGPGTTEDPKPWLPYARQAHALLHPKPTPPPPTAEPLPLEAQP